MKNLSAGSKSPFVYFACFVVSTSLSGVVRKHRSADRLSTWFKIFATLLCGCSIAATAGAGEAGPRPPRLKIERAEKHLTVRARLSGEGGWFELLNYVTDSSGRPYLHPVRDPSGRVVLTDDRPSDHPWQHGIFTGFHGLMNGHEFWMENDGRQRFVRLLDLKEGNDRISWRALTELIEPAGRIVAEEEDSITVFAPDSSESYGIEFGFLLRAKERAVTLDKSGVGGLAVRMPWEKADPRHTHLNSNGLRGRQCEQKRAAWCNVERPFGDDVFGLAVFDHPSNPGHPSAWRVDEQGLINPSVTALNGWSIPAGETRAFRYRILVYRGSASAERLDREFKAFAAASAQAGKDSSGDTTPK